ncbi:PotC protein [Roseibium sp. TrichSKD4]|nr:PotC protein [Roseibium sp. TrichSKD4]
MSQAKLNKILLYSLVAVCALWLIIPFTMAILWSLVDPTKPWTADKLLPPVMSFYRWQYLWENSSLQQAMINSYTLAPTAAVLALVLATPTAFAFGRLSFPGKSVAQTLALLPLIVPGFVTAVFFTAFLFRLGFAHWRFGGIVLAHCVLFMPFAVRIMTVSFETVRQDHIDAARDLGASTCQRWKVAYLPALKPGVFASLLIVFIYSIEEFAVAFILGSPDFVTIPTLLFSQMGQDFVRPNAAVLSLILVVPNVFLMLGLEKLMRSANPALASGKG